MPNVDFLYVMGVAGVLYYHRTVLLINPFRSPACWALTGLSLLFSIQTMHMLSNIATYSDHPDRDLLLLIAFFGLNTLSTGVFSWVSLAYLTQRDDEIRVSLGGEPIKY